MVRIEAASLSSGRVRRYSLAGETNHGPLKTFYPEFARTRCLFRGSLVLLRLFLELGFCFMTGGLRATNQ
jgi:hypothetical protein